MHNLLKHYTEYRGEWLWKNFLPWEVACSCCGEYFHDHKSLTAIQLLRDSLGRPITITSGHRCAMHNHEVGGKDASYHLKLAFDCICPREDQEAFTQAAMAVGFNGVIRYLSKGIVHLDIRPTPYQEVVL